MAKSKSQVRNLMILVALMGLAFGVFKAMHRRAICLKKAAEFEFMRAFNRDRIGPLDQQAARSRTRDTLNARIKSEEADRARAEARRCAGAAKLYRSIADRPWMGLPSDIPLPEYAPDRSRKVHL